MLALHKISNKIITGIKKNKREYNALKNKLYPNFVFDKNIKTIENEIPVFTLHSVNPNKFEDQLQYLKENNYKTLNSEQIYKCLIGENKIEERTIGLTFDDGWKNLFTVAFPLLKKYDFRATCFLIPNLITSEKDKGISENNENKNFPDSNIMCNWKEIKEMHESGYVDFQSHSLNHYLISVNSKVNGFFYPNFNTYPFNIDLPLLRFNGEENFSRSLKFGTPIYENESRFCGKKRFFDDEKLRIKCVEFVEKKGKEDFFKKTFWQKELNKFVEEYKNQNITYEKYETDSEMRESIYNEMYLSKIKIEEKLKDKIVQHFCYPWWAGSRIASEISREAGYLSNYWGIIPDKKTNKLLDDPFRISRILSDDFIYTLPGKRRKSLSKVIYNKYIYEMQLKFIN